MGRVYDYERGGLRTAAELQTQVDIQCPLFLAKKKGGGVVFSLWEEVCNDLLANLYLLRYFSLILIVFV